MFNSTGLPSTATGTRVSGRTSPLVVVTCCSVLALSGFVGYREWSQWKREQAAEEVSKKETARAALSELEKRIAIADRKAIAGMSAYEVLMAKGEPLIIQKGAAINEELHRAGITEIWLYNNEAGSFVAFDYSRYVIASSDIKAEKERKDSMRYRQYSQRAESP